jgi:hypothetical protein
MLVFTGQSVVPRQERDFSYSSFMEGLICSSRPTCHPALSPKMLIFMVHSKRFPAFWLLGVINAMVKMWFVPVKTHVTTMKGGRNLMSNTSWEVMITLMKG